MPNKVSLHLEEKGDWKAYVFTGLEHDDWGKHLCHSDIDPPNLKRLAFVAHHDEIMALLQSEDINNALYGLVADSLRSQEALLHTCFDQLRAEKYKERVAAMGKDATS